MGGFSRTLVRQIRQIFPASQNSVNNPDQLSDDVQFIADILPGTLRLNEVQNQEVQGAVGVPVIDTSQVPADRYWYITAAHQFHDDPAARGLSIFIRNNVISVATMIDSSDFQADGALVATNIIFPCHRPFLVPPRWVVRFAASGIGVTSNLNGVISFLELPLMEKPPPL